LTIHKRTQGQTAAIHNVQTDFQGHHIQNQEPPKSPMIPFTYACSQEITMMIKSCDAGIAGGAMMGTERRVKLTLVTVFSSR